MFSNLFLAFCLLRLREQNKINSYFNQLQSYFIPVSDNKVRLAASNKIMETQNTNTMEMGLYVPLISFLLTLRMWWIHLRKPLLVVVTSMPLLCSMEVVISYYFQHPNLRSNFDSIRHIMQYLKSPIRSYWLYPMSVSSLVSSHI